MATEYPVVKLSEIAYTTGLEMVEKSRMGLFSTEIQRVVQLQGQCFYAMGKIMKKLPIFFVTITWILYSTASCVADDFCPSSLRLDSGAVSIKSVKDEVLSSCGIPATKSAKPDSSYKNRYNYRPVDYIHAQSNKLQHVDRGH
jgi:hypothetical protein